MTALQALVTRCEALAPGFVVHWGFHGDLESFLEEEAITGPAIFLAVGPHIPTGHNEDGEADFTEIFTVHLRADVMAAGSMDLYDQFITLRNGLSNCPIPELDRFMEIVAASPGYERGSFDAQLTLQI